MDQIVIKGKVNTAICYARVVEEEAIEQIRRMCDYIGFPVRNLKRIKFGTLSLKGLSKGKMRELNEDEAETLKKAAKLNG